MNNNNEGVDMNWKATAAVMAVAMIILAIAAHCSTGEHTPKQDPDHNGAGPF